jgi:hypothetical protein
MQLYARDSQAPVRPSPPRHHADAATFLERLCAVTGCEPVQLRATRRGRAGNAARRMAAYWLVCGAGLRVVDAARALAMHPVRASQSVNTVRARLGGHTQEGAWLHALENWPEKGLISSS